MELNEFQRRAAEHITKHEGVLQCFTLGLGEEAGEVLKEVTKLWRYLDKTEPADLDPEEVDHIMDEMGDVLWYLAMISQLLGRNVEDLPKHNLDKLHYRRKIKEYEGMFNSIFPDADKDFSKLYWEKVRKVRRYHNVLNPDGHLFLIFPAHDGFFAGHQEFSTILVSRTDAATLSWLRGQALMDSNIWTDYAWSKRMMGKLEDPKETL